MRRLRGMTWDNPRGYDPLIAAAEAFTALHPSVRIDWDKRSLQGFESTPVDELAQSYDLMIIDHPHVGAVVAQDCLLPFGCHANPADLARLQGETVGKSFESYFYLGQQWALPVDAACQVQAVRPDQLPAPVAHFDDVLLLARDGRVVWPLRPPHVLMSFFTLMANLGHPFPVAKGEEIHRATARKVIERMTVLARLVDPACHGADPIAALDMLAEGPTFALSPLTYLYAPYSRENYRKHQLAYHDIPALGRSGPLGSALGGTGIAISAHTRHPKLCTEFAVWLASSAVQCGLYTAHNGQPGNAIAWSDMHVNRSVADAYRNTRMSHEAAWLRPRHNGYMAFQEEGSEILLDAILRDRPADFTLDALQSCLDESYLS